MPSEKYPIYAINKWNGGQTISLLVGGRSLWPTGLSLKENSYKAKVKTRKKTHKMGVDVSEKSRDGGTNTESWGVTQTVGRGAPAAAFTTKQLPIWGTDMGIWALLPEKAAVREQVTSRGSSRDWSGFNLTASSSPGHSPCPGVDWGYTLKS